MNRALKTGALGQPKGMGWGGKWEQGLGQGHTCTPVADHVSIWQKPLHYCKVIRLQLIKINGKKIKKQTKKRK